MKKFKLLFLLIFILICIVFVDKFYLTKNTSDSETKSEQVENNKTEESNENKIKIGRDNIKGALQPTPLNVAKQKLKELAVNNSNYNYVLENLQKLPAPQIKLLANNEDAMEYILGFIKIQNNEHIDTYSTDLGETVELNRKYPYYIQWDKRWAYDSLGSDSIAIGGCGPTTVAMAISGITGDKSITPKTIVTIENAAGFYTPQGTSWSFFPYIANKYNLKSKNISKNKNIIDNELNLSHPVIVSVKPGKFTTIGHIILITKLNEDGSYEINDPNSYARTLKSWTFDELKTEIVNLWSYSK